MPASLTQPLERGFGGCQWFLLRRVESEFGEYGK